MPNPNGTQTIFNRGDTSFGDWSIVTPGTPFTTAVPRGLVVISTGSAILQSEPGFLGASTPGFGIITLSALAANTFLPLMPYCVLTGGSATLAALW